MARQYWLFKSEPDVFSIDDLASRPEQREPWDGVRNYQARNFMRDQIKKGDLVLFYHSNCEPPGVVGIAEISGEARPDPSSWNPKSPYYDPKVKPGEARWLMVEVQFKEKFSKIVTLDTIKSDPKLKDMLVARRGNRLSITPVTEKEFQHICQLGR